MFESTTNILLTGAWFLTIALVLIIWKLADRVRSEPYAFLTHLSSAIVAVFFVFFLTPMIIWAGMTGLFVATYVLFIVGAIGATIYMIETDKRSSRG